MKSKLFIVVFILMNIYSCKPSHNQTATRNEYEIVDDCFSCIMEDINLQLKETSEEVKKQFPSMKLDAVDEYSGSERYSFVKNLKIRNLSERPTNFTFYFEHGVLFSYEKTFYSNEAELDILKNNCLFEFVSLPNDSVTTFYKSDECRKMIVRKVIRRSQSYSLQIEGETLADKPYIITYTVKKTN
ncbi:MAG: hypothetical protein AAFN93_21385 [Bacteroidota bacterium]